MKKFWGEFRKLLNAAIVCFTGRLFDDLVKKYLERPAAFPGDFPAFRGLLLVVILISSVYAIVKIITLMNLIAQYMNFVEAFNCKPQGGPDSALTVSKELNEWAKQLRNFCSEENIIVTAGAYDFASKFHLKQSKRKVQEWCNKLSAAQHTVKYWGYTVPDEIGRALEFAEAY